jgi:hypothetical protein
MLMRYSCLAGGSLVVFAAVRHVTETLNVRIAYAGYVGR